MNLQQTNWLWQAYLALAARGDLTEKQGRNLLRKTFPEFAYVLDDVISSRGDNSKLDSRKLDLFYSTLADEEAGMAATQINEGIRKAAAGKPLKDSDINKTIRSEKDQRLDDLFDAFHGKPAKPDQTAAANQAVNDAVRAKAGRATV